MTTPRQVRAEMRRQGLTYEIHKAEGSWYVVGPGTELWQDRCLYVTTFAGITAAGWIEIIQSMARLTCGYPK